MNNSKATLENGPGPPKAKGNAPPLMAAEGRPFALAQEDHSELAVGQEADEAQELQAAASVTAGVGCALVQDCHSELVVQSPPLPCHGPPEVGRFLPLVALKVACGDAVTVWPALAQPCAMTW